MIIMTMIRMKIIRMMMILRTVMMLIVMILMASLITQGERIPNITPGSPQVLNPPNLARLGTDSEIIHTSFINPLPASLMS